MLEKILLTVDQAKWFGIVNAEKIKQSYIELEIVEIKDDKDQTEIISFFKIENNESVKLNLTFNKPFKDFRKVILLTWILAKSGTAYGGLEKYKNRAKNLVNQLINARKNSCYPYYIAYKYRLRNSDIFATTTGDLYSVKESPDTFPDYYRLLWEQDANKIRAIGAIRDGNKKFPKDSGLALILASYYLKQSEYKKCLEILKQIPQSSVGEWFEECQKIYLKFTAYLELSLFEEAQNALENCRSSKDVKSFFLGILFYRKKDYDKAILYFTETIEFSKEDDDFVIASMYYLINAYIAKDNLRQAIETLNFLPHKSYDFEITYYGMNFSDIADHAVALLLKQDLNELVHAKVKALSAYVNLKNHLPDTEVKRLFTKKEVNILNEALVNAKNAVTFYPDNGFLNYIFSQLLYLDKKFDDAHKYAVIAMSNDPGLLCVSSSLQDCSEDFLDSYDTLIKNLLDLDIIPVTKYIESVGKFDIEGLFQTKRYEQIVNLTRQLEKEIARRTTKGVNTDLLDVAFEIAYSLKETGNIHESKNYYELLSKFGKENSSSLNNLAIIYEELKDQKMAEKSIKMAKKLLGGMEDKIVEKNYARIVSHSKAQKDKAADHIKITQKRSLEFDIRNGDVLLNSKKIHIADEGDYQYHICKVVLTASTTLGEWVKEQDIEDGYSVGEPKSGRWVRDAVYKINRKIKEKTEIKIFLEYNNAKIRLNPALL